METQELHDTDILGVKKMSRIYVCDVIGYGFTLMIVANSEEDARKEAEISAKNLFGDSTKVMCKEV